MKKTNKSYCTECPYFADVVYEDEQWYGARCKKMDTQQCLQCMQLNHFITVAH